MMGDRIATLCLAVALVATAATSARSAPLDPVPPLSAAGRWLVDATGRVVMLHGVNEVAKSAPYYPAARGFGEDDVAFLASEGLNALRLGIDLRGLMPTPGVIEDAYVDEIATTVAQATAAGLFVLLDIHQDGFAPKYNGNGFPNWMAIDDGLENPPDAVFPLYYILNPAMQRAFESFWANRAIPDGLGLQDYYMQVLEGLASRFGQNPMILGTDVMNEPWPGADWQTCAAPGCPDLERSLLVPFHDRAAGILRALAPDQLVFAEPFVLFTFGQAATSLPGTEPGHALSFHSYALDVAAERNVVRQAVIAAERDGAPLLVTEFGASSDPVLLNRLTAQFEEFRVPWMFWAYNEQIVRNRLDPLTPALVDQTTMNALVRPYPVATAGVPTRIAFDPVTRVFDLAYTTLPAAGGTFRRRADTLVHVPKRQYPDGYTVAVSGARVRSKPCATELRLRTRKRGAPVTVRITPGVISAPQRRRCGL